MLDLQDGPEERQAVATGLEQLTEWATGISFDDIPPDVSASAALVLFDDIGAMVAARAEPELARLQDGLLTHRAVEEATVFRGGRTRTDRYSAAIANGAASDWCELDEGYRVTSCHAGIYILPALLAEAEATALPANQVIRSLVVAYEVVTRFARTFPTITQTFHPHAAYSAIGAAAATGLARGLSSETLRAALTNATTCVAPGPSSHTGAGALVRNVWPALGAGNGMRAADWADCGITGLAGSPYDVFATGFGADCKPTEMTQGLGGIWAITQNFQKLHACCQFLHSSVETMLDLRQKFGDAVSPENIARITIETHPRAQKLDGTRPETTLGAKFSLPHAAAAVAVLGHAGADSFAAHRLDDPDINALRHKVEILPFEALPDWPNDRPSRIGLTLQDGTKVESECLSARGGPDRPFAREEILEKIDGICDPVYPALGGVARQAIALDAGLLNQPWDKAVAEITGSG
ncbi:MAG: MmgE/PrpD family protein [Alphaproteobacteria bacterium]|nr:MmgE/PrpD family protein [Alphaproteobacteria bacterium]